MIRRPPARDRDNRQSLAAVQQENRAHPDAYDLAFGTLADNGYGHSTIRTTPTMPCPQLSAQARSGSPAGCGGPTTARCPPAPWSCAAAPANLRPT
jgi:hypothetical protein